MRFMLTNLCSVHKNFRVLNRIGTGDTRKNFIIEEIQRSLTTVRVKRVLSPGVDFTCELSRRFARFDAMPDVPALVLNLYRSAKYQFVHRVERPSQSKGYHLYRKPSHSRRLNVTMYAVASA